MIVRSLGKKVGGIVEERNRVMRRQGVIEGNLPEVLLFDISDDDLVRIDSAIEHFLASTPHNNKTICDLVRSDVRKGRLHTETLERFSVWCHTRQPPKKVVDAAEGLARELLGLVPPRLRDVGEKRIENYDSLVRALVAALSPLSDSQPLTNPDS